MLKQILIINAPLSGGMFDIIYKLSSRIMALIDDRRNEEGKLIFLRCSKNPKSRRGKSLRIFVSY